MSIFFSRLLVILICCGSGATMAASVDFASLCDDRVAVERVYYDHRLGTKPPFDESLPRATIERLVRQDLHKEAVLKKVYAVEITPTMVEIEVQRINSTTRAPEMLAELKAALGNDPARFARTVARPIVVERTLRARFENDDPLHATVRKQAESLRERLLRAKNAGDDADRLSALMKEGKTGSFSEASWQLGSRPADAGNSTPTTIPAVPAKATARSSLYAVEATAQLAQVLDSPERRSEPHSFYFEDLPSELQNVLRVQLRQPGDVSAVIEMPGGFVVYVLKSRTPELMMASCSSIEKCSYESWLAGLQTDFNSTSRVIPDQSP